MRGLPAEGAVAQAEGIWPDATTLQVGAIEMLDAIARLIYAQSGKRPPGDPLRVPRPGDKPKRDRTSDRMSMLLEAVSTDGAT